MSDCYCPDYDKARSYIFTTKLRPKMKPVVYQFFVALFAAFGSFLYGYDLGVIASVIASDSFATKFLMVDGTTKSGTTVALFTAGKSIILLQTLSSNLTRWFLRSFCCRLL